MTFLNQPEMRKYGLPIVLLLLGALLLVFVGIPSFNKIRRLQSQIGTEEGRVLILQAKSRKLLDFTDQGTYVDEQAALFEEAIASGSEVPGLLTQVQEISNSCGMEVTALQFGGEVSPEEGEEAGSQGEGVREIRLQFASEGTFRELTCLLEALESAGRLVDLESLSYSTETGEEVASDLISTEAILLSYYIPDPLLVPDNPITFSFSDPTYVEAAEVLETLTPYK